MPWRLHTNYFPWGFKRVYLPCVSLWIANRFLSHNLDALHVSLIVNYENAVYMFTSFCVFFSFSFSVLFCYVCLFGFVIFVYEFPLGYLWSRIWDFFVMLCVSFSFVNVVQFNFNDLQYIFSAVLQLIFSWLSLYFLRSFHAWE